MNYINYFDFLNVDKKFFLNKEYHDFRKMYRLFKMIGRYLNTSIMQYNRIEQWADNQKTLHSRNSSGIDAAETELIFSDLHFLLLSMDKCYKCEQMLYNLLTCYNEAAALKSSPQVNDIRIM